jgi:ADP-heptose:LPS heptosyltransferase
MEKKNWLNRQRRKLTGLLKKSLPELKPSHIKNKESIRKILVVRPNHRLGNQLMITPLLQELNATFPNAKIDLFLKGNTCLIIFKNFDYVDKLLRLPKKHFKEFYNYIIAFWNLKKTKYDLVFNVDVGSSSGKLATHHAQSQIKFSDEDRLKQIQAKYPEAKHLAKQAVYRLRAGLQGHIDNLNLQPIPNLSLSLSALEKSKAQAIVKDKLGQTDKIISLFTYATGDKQLSKEWWDNFYKVLLKEFPDYAILEILPIENISLLDFKAPSYYGKDIRLISAVIQQSDVFIGADSGIMHLSATSQTPTIGLFKVTNPDVYAPYSKGSMAFPVKDAHLNDLVNAVTKALNLKDKN